MALPKALSIALGASALLAVILLFSGLPAQPPPREAICEPGSVARRDYYYASPGADSGDDVGVGVGVASSGADASFFSFLYARSSWLLDLTCMMGSGNVHSGQMYSFCAFAAVALAFLVLGHFVDDRLARPLRLACAGLVRLASCATVEGGSNVAFPFAVSVSVGLGFPVWNIVFILASYVHGPSLLLSFHNCQLLACAPVAVVLLSTHLAPAWKASRLVQASGLAAFCEDPSSFVSAAAVAVLVYMLVDAIPDLSILLPSLAVAFFSGSWMAASGVLGLYFKKLVVCIPAVLFAAFLAYLAYFLLGDVFHEIDVEDKLAADAAVAAEAALVAGKEAQAAAAASVEAAKAAQEAADAAVEAARHAADQKVRRLAALEVRLLKVPSVPILVQLANAARHKYLEAVAERVAATATRDAAAAARKAVHAAEARKLAAESAAEHAEISAGANVFFAFCRGVRGVGGARRG